MKIIIGADHGGFSLKELLRVHLLAESYDVVDVGAFSPDACDYPDIVRDFVANFAYTQGDKGVLICGSGQGVCMAANRVAGIRAALCRTVDDARLARLHNDANVCCLGGRITSLEDAIGLVGTFLTEKFEGGRHACRVAKLENIQE